MYKKGTGNDKQGKDTGNRTLCPYRNFSQAIITFTQSWMLSRIFRMEHSFLLSTRKMAALRMIESHMMLFVAPTGVGKTHLALDSPKREYLKHFDFVIILCPTLRHTTDGSGFGMILMSF